MHTYELATEPADDAALPRIREHTFHDALDVVAWAALDRTIGWATWPEVWHLDDEGRLRCCTHGSSLDSVRSWAENPPLLHRSRAEGLRTGDCPARWVIVESRPAWMRDGAIVSEDDARAFLALRRDLAGIQVNLADAVIFDDKCHWWSMHELTSGSTRW